MKSKLKDNKLINKHTTKNQGITESIGRNHEKVRTNESIPSENRK